MAHDELQNTDRRAFLQASAGITASALTLSASASAEDAPAKAPTVPTRVLGKTGVHVTMLDQGAVRTQNLEGIFRLSFAAGVRVFDTAKAYRSEPDFKKWFERAPELRKQIFLVTKDSPRTPKQMITMLDERLETLGTDYVDLFFIHGLGDGRTVDEAINMVTSQEFKETAETIRKSGKARFVGFSSHNVNRAQIIEAAGKAGYVDAIMLQYTPWLEKDSPLNRALDICHEKGVGLISMKQTAGQFGGRRRGGPSPLDEVAKRVPMLAEKKLTPHQGLLHAIWTDERISTVCISMRNTDQIRQNADAARRFEPLKTAEIHQLRDAALAHGPMLCADCDGRCSEAAGTTAALGDLTRFLTYHEFHGDRAEARRQYAALPPEARNWKGADLEAARAACPNRLDFAELLPDVDRHLA